MINNVRDSMVQEFYFSRQKYQIFRFLSVVSLVFVVLYILNGGLQKIFLLGSGLSPKEFRFAETFADSNSGAMALLQIARRVFFPLIISVYAIKRSFGKPLVDSKYFYFLLVIFLFSVLITLDRAPLIMFLLVFFYIWFLKARINLAFYVSIPFFLLMILFFGGLMTFLQHNIINIKFLDVVEAGFQFLWHRIWAAPAIVGIELSTILFPFDSEKLFLQHSRLMVLFGAERVGSEEDASIFVGPVSYVGDIWRNFSMWGILIFSFLLGALMGFFDYVNRRIQIPLAAGLGILTITLGFYLTHGVFFSLGVFFQIFFMVFFCVYSQLFFGFRK